MRKGQVAEKIKKMYNDIGYACKVQVLLAAEYGVPQLRERVFFIGTKDSSVQNIKISKTRRKEAKQKKLFEVDCLPPFLKVKDVLSDILDLTPFSENKGNNLVMDYNKPPKTQYQEYLRKNSDKLYEHVGPNHSDEVIDRIAHIEQG